VRTIRKARAAPSGDRGRGDQCVPEIRIGEDETIGRQAEMRHRLEERGVEEALVEHERQRRDHSRCGQRNDDQPEQDEGKRHSDDVHAVWGFVYAAC
jgi:hypothetical protein